MSMSSNLSFYCYLSSVAGDGFPHNNNIDARRKYSRNRFSFHFRTPLVFIHSLEMLLTDGSVISQVWYLISAEMAERKVTTLEFSLQNVIFVNFIQNSIFVAI